MTPQGEPASTVGRPSRALAPDLARGMMLLLIVLANIPWYLWGADRGLYTGHPVEGGLVDRVVQGITIVMIDGRALPMYALLFGYGMVQFERSQRSRGTSVRSFRAMLGRRHVAMIALGALHAGLLFFGDILGTYGVLGLVLTVLLFGRSTRTISVVRWVCVGLTACYAALMVVLGWLTWRFPEEAENVPAQNQVAGIDSWVGSIVPRLSEWAFVTTFSLFVFVIPAAVLTGWIWARRGLLDRPQDHLPALRRTAVVGLPLAWLSSIPYLLTHLGVVLTPDFSWMFMGVQMLSGLAGGLGYAALFGLLAAHLGDRPGAVATSLAAVGRRSLSAYLWQALIFAPLLAAWGFGLGGTIGSAAAAGIGVLIWLASVAWSTWLERAGRRGPAETVLRAVTYGRT